MKKVIRILTAICLLAAMALTLTACGNRLSGKYEANVGEGTLFESKIAYEFSGDQVTMTITEDTILGATKTTSYTGTYEIADDQITFDLENYILGKVTYSFSQGTIDGEKVIIIDGRTYTKVK